MIRIFYWNANWAPACRN